MEIVYPPVGIAHITSQLPDLIADRAATAATTRVACAMQPKAAPHFGTGVVIMTAFALARLFRDHFGKPATVLLDMLDNAPAQTVTISGTEHTLCLSHARDAGIGYTMRTYSQIQAQPGFRHGLATILSRPEDFEPLFSPSEHRLRVRPVCPHCGLVDKTARTVRTDSENGLTLTYPCPRHGRQTARLDDPAAVIDANTPVRTVLRSLCFAHDRAEHATETIVLNGGDWAGTWMQRVYFDGLHQLGCTGLPVPFNIFTPQILDDSGAKLSKTIYLTRGAYADIPPAWTAMHAFHDRFGPAGLDKLWDEISGWTQSPARFFRNYTIRYLEHIFTQPGQVPGTATAHAS